MKLNGSVWPAADLSMLIIIQVFQKQKIVVR